MLIDDSRFFDDSHRKEETPAQKECWMLQLSFVSI